LACEVLADAPCGHAAAAAKPEIPDKNPKSSRRRSAVWGASVTCAAFM
jgi:hypothetical protein